MNHSGLCRHSLLFHHFSCFHMLCRYKKHNVFQKEGWQNSVWCTVADQIRLESASFAQRSQFLAWCVHVLHRMLYSLTFIRVVTRRNTWSRVKYTLDTTRNVSNPQRMHVVEAMYLHAYTVGLLIVKSAWAENWLLTGTCEALDNLSVIRTKF